MIILVFGLPGSGKSFFAERLAQKTGSVYISSDRIRKKTTTGDKYTPEAKIGIYFKMKDIADKALTQGKNVVLDATFYRIETRDIFKELSQKHHLPLYLIEVNADEDLIRERVIVPRQDSEADFAVYQLIKRQFEPVMEPHLILQSARDNIEDMLTLAADYIQRKS